MSAQGEEHARPSGWAAAYLDAVADIVLGQSPPSATYNRDGVGLPFYQGKADFGSLYPTTRVWCSRPTRTANGGGVLFSVRAPIGPANLSREVCGVGRGLAALHGAGGVEASFLLHLLRRHERDLADLGTGTTFRAITGPLLRRFVVSVPPLAEQSRIAAKLDELFSRLDAAVAQLKETQRRLKAYRQAVLRDAFTGKLTQAWREEQLKDPESPLRNEPASVLLERIREEREKAEGKRKRRKLPPLDTSELPALPEGWVWARLPELGSVDRGKSKHRPRNDAKLYDGGTYPFIQTGEVKAAKVYVTTYRQTYNERGLRQSRLWDAGTLCVTIAANIAETAILGIPACFPDSIAGFVPRHDLGDARFVHYFFRTVRGQLEAFAPATAQKNINLATLVGLALPFPHPLEQRTLVDDIERRFSLADALEQTIERSLRQAERLRQSILKSAFEGKLVPQDPSDEPAGKLLERIRAERERHAAEQKAARKTGGRRRKQEKAALL